MRVLRLDTLSPSDSARILIWAVMTPQFGASLDTGLGSLFTGTVGSKLKRHSQFAGWTVVADQVSGRFAVPAFVDRTMIFVVADLEGNIAAHLPVTFHPTEWSSDGSHLIGYEVLEGENETMSDANLMVWSLADSSMIRLTTGREIMETEPAWHPTEPWIAYIDDADHWLVIARLESETE